MSQSSSVPAAEFKLSITRALADQLADALASLQPAHLTAEHLNMVQPRPGVYELFVDGQRVYVGKASKNLRLRLANHLRKLSGRVNISLDRIGFLCLYVDEDLEAAAPEKMLIKKYKDFGGAPWNTNGFGNKDPGRQRDHSLVKENHFDAIFPIDLDIPIVIGEPGTCSVNKYLIGLKSNLPYTFRFETTPAAKSDYRDFSIELPRGSHTVRELLNLAVDALPSGWQSTALPGYVIMYREAENYNSASLFWRKENDSVHELTGEAKFDSSGEVDEPQATDGD